MLAHQQNIKNKNKLIQYLQWDIYGGCNYNCSYCLVDRKKIGQSPVPPDPILFLDKFKEALPGSWHFFLCGPGEPFLTPRFQEIVRCLVKMGHKVGIRTNLSHSSDTFLEFCKTARGEIFEFGASLHLEQADTDEFLRKALLVKNILGNIFFIVTVARPGQIDKLISIGERFRAFNIRFILQPERDHDNNNLHNPYVEYSTEEKSKITEFMSEQFILNNIRKQKLKGQMCLTGKNHIVVKRYGNVWRCNPAAREGSKNGYLGNLFDNQPFLTSGSTVCRHELCYCGTPSRLNLISM